MNIKETLKGLSDIIKVSALEKYLGLPAKCIRLYDDTPISEKYVKTIEDGLLKIGRVLIGDNVLTDKNIAEPIIKEVMTEKIVEKIVYKDRPVASNPTMFIAKPRITKAIDIEGVNYTKLNISHHILDVFIRELLFPDNTKVIYFLADNVKKDAFTNGINILTNEGILQYENFMNVYVKTDIYNKVSSIKK